MVILSRCHTFGNIVPCFWGYTDAHRSLIPIPIEGPDNSNRGLSVLVLSLIKVDFQWHKQWFSQSYKVVGVFASALEHYVMRILKNNFLKSAILDQESRFFKMRLRIDNL